MSQEWEPKNECELKMFTFFIQIYFERWKLTAIFQELVYDSTGLTILLQMSFLNSWFAAHEIMSLSVPIPEI